MSHRNAATEVSAGGILPIAASWSPSPARWRSPALPRQQLARIDAPIGTVVVQAKGMDSLRAALDRAKILPTWTPRSIAVTFSRQGVSFLADVRRPFVFGKLAAADVQGVQTDVSYGRPRALAEIVVQVQVGSEIVDIPITPLKLTHEFVVQATIAEAAQLARDAADALGLPAHAE